MQNNISILLLNVLGYFSGFSWKYLIYVFENDWLLIKSKCISLSTYTTIKALMAHSTITVCKKKLYIYTLKINTILLHNLLFKLNYTIF